MPRRNKPVAEPQPEAVRYVRLHLPDSTYRAVRHRLVEAGPRSNISMVITQLLEVGLELYEAGRP